MEITKPHDGQYGIDAMQRFTLGISELAVATYTVFSDNRTPVDIVADIPAIIGMYPNAQRLLGLFPQMKLEASELSRAEWFFTGHTFLAALDLTFDKIEELQATKSIFPKTVFTRSASGEEIGIEGTKQFFDGLAELTAAGFRIFGNGFQVADDVPAILSQFPKAAWAAAQFQTVRLEMGDLTFTESIELGQSALESIKNAYLAIAAPFAA